ncbi:hypothetical protein BU24DRAFT_443142 [Aaosphaeria arxii CBS 175.79]|uniref:DUF4440 domain-containing protein n=1 Tax=Aaosphaeria arxii CBS 175.79 TaxID=1450172 RepID=A0A6A5XIY5_9PLEO|nr:uncharacterized protein BU24DRAFT_443142 [Aaosphaeria arxii CBS 175.79]KAF2012826.1 hypothetical protein BU24DRAFT_443142 [Aaosphaeria arxii CBS 175.79]
MSRRTWAALCSSGAELLPLLSSNPVMIFPGDNVFTAASSPTLEQMLTNASYKPWKNYTLSHDEVIPLGESSALIYYRVEATRDDATFRAICSSVWLREGDSAQDWKMVSHQQTLF